MHIWGDIFVELKKNYIIVERFCHSLKSAYFMRKNMPHIKYACSTWRNLPFTPEKDPSPRSPFFPSTSSYRPKTKFCFFDAISSKHRNILEVNAEITLRSPGFPLESKFCVGSYVWNLNDHMTGHNFLCALQKKQLFRQHIQAWFFFLAQIFVFKSNANYFDGDIKSGRKPEIAFVGLDLKSDRKLLYRPQYMPPLKK